MKFTNRIRIFLQHIKKVMRYRWRKTVIRLNITAHINFFRQSLQRLVIYEDDPNYLLKPLYPTVELKEHAKYVNSLNLAVRDKRITNIAITGHYGSGKSSIIEQFTIKRKKHVVQISFSSLGANIEKYITTNKEDAEDKRLTTLSNLIQKEIVKQILFNDKPSVLKYSRYKRASKPNIFSTLLWGLVISVLLTGLAYSRGWHEAFIPIFSGSGLISWYIGVAVFVSTWLIITVLILKISSKVKLEKITGGPFSLALTGENSYFDEYLDEIIYYFETTGKSIVVIEDIDRFNTLYIFENLRQLNNILNNARQIKQRVRFIYAVKDSIFVQNTFDDSQPNLKTTETATNEDTTQEKDNASDNQGNDGPSRVTNRTKFFDLIIPVVPFITHTTSRTFIRKELGNIKISDGVIEIVSKHLTDMRLIKNICNEFIIFYDKVIVSSKLDLSPDRLFALVVYKNLYLKDFEDIKEGNSLLDKIEEEKKKFIKKTNTSIIKEIRVLEQKINNQTNVNRRATEYGERLLTYVKDVAVQTEMEITSYALGGAPYTEETIRSIEFWQGIGEANTEAEFTVTYVPRSYRAATQSVTKDYIINTLLEGYTDIQAFTEKDRQQLRIELKETASRHNELSHLSIGSLMVHYGFDENILQVLKQYPSVEPKMILELYRSDYIDSYYILYTSLYPAGGMSPNALNYVIQIIDRGEQDVHYPLENQNDIKRILDENLSYASEASMYNHDILNYLIKNSSHASAPIILKNIGDGKYDPSDFIREFINITPYLEDFIKKITPYWPDVFTYLTSTESKDQKTKNTLLGIALAHTSRNTQYAHDDSVTSYIIQNARHIPSLRDASIKGEITSIDYILSRLNVRFKDLATFSPKVKELAINQGLYVVNEPNLRQALNSKDYALDVIKRSNTTVYNHILNYLNEYTDMLEKGSRTVRSLAGESGFEEVINDVVDHDRKLLGRILDKAKLSNCIVINIKKIKSGGWLECIEHTIIVNNLSNMLAYYSYSQSENEPLDEVFSKYLSTAGSIVLDQEYSSYDASLVKHFVTSVLRTSGIPAIIKASITKICFPDDYLSVSDVGDQQGELFGLLLKNGSIEDSADILNQLVHLSWETRKQYILNSSQINSYLDEVQWTKNDIDNMTLAERFDELKMYILANIVENENIISPGAANRLAEYAYAKNVAMLPDNLLCLVTLSGGRLRDEVSISLINLISDADLTKDNLVQMLRQLSDPYPRLTYRLRHPRLLNENYNLLLIQKLDKLSMIRRYYEVNDAKEIQVNMKAAL